MRTVSPLLLFLLLRCGPSSGYGGGAPRSQCGSLMPGHGGAAQDTGTSPYEVKVTDETEEMMKQSRKIICKISYLFKILNLSVI